jgi:hypothetical protein
MDGIFGRVVAVVLLLLAMAGVGYAAYSGFSLNTSGRIVTDLTLFTTNVRALFAQGNTGYANLTTANLGVLISEGVFPSDMLRAGTAVDGWGNPITLSSTNGGTYGVIGLGGNETVEQCTKVVISVKDYVQLSVGGTVFTQTTQPDPITAQVACTGGGDIQVTFQ